MILSVETGDSAAHTLGCWHCDLLLVAWIVIPLGCLIASWTYRRGICCKTPQMMVPTWPGWHVISVLTWLQLFGSLPLPSLLCWHLVRRLSSTGFSSCSQKAEERHDCLIQGRGNNLTLGKMSNTLQMVFWSSISKPAPVPGATLINSVNGGISMLLSEHLFGH